MNSDIYFPIVTLIIAILGVFIAWLQWNTNRSKLKLDLFDRRMKVYDVSRKYCRSNIIRVKGRDYEELEQEFYVQSSNAYLLFSDEIGRYLDDCLWKKACEASVLRSELKLDASEEEKTAMRAKLSELTRWFMDQRKEIDTMFRPHLRIKH